MVIQRMGPGTISRFSKCSHHFQLTQRGGVRIRTSPPWKQQQANSWLRSFSSSSSMHTRGNTGEESNLKDAAMSLSRQSTQNQVTSTILSTEAPVASEKPSSSSAAAEAEAAGEKTVASSKPRRKRRPRKDPIILTDNAVRRLKVLMDGKDDVLGVRLGVKTRGCNGLSYTMDYATERQKFEDQVTKDGVNVLIEPKALMHLIGTTMDYEEDELTAEFTFNNPNSKGTCGCGESFNV